MFKAKKMNPVKELADTYNRLFSTLDGKLVLKDLESFCGFRKTSVCESLPNSEQTMFAEGKRRVYLRIDSMVEISDKETKEKQNEKEA